MSTNNRTGEEQLMVSVRGAYKNLGSHQVLNGLDMSVRKNNIYGLLGPSGCGKTVLLGCILGMRTLSRGQISLAVNHRRNVGYMPQEVALFKEFTIKEIFIFYGRLFGMNVPAVRKRVEDYGEVLGLPDWEHSIGSLSGGEQRRVSFAVTLLHDPELLVLDEPTVGVDSILSLRIWKYLLKLSSAGKTIIITTHYVEEARHAHCIGMMRAGVLLCEDAPEKVMNQSASLEDAFLELSKKQDECSQLTGLYLNSTLLISKPINETLPSVPLQNEDKFNKDRFIAQLIKNILWMKRNTMIMTFLLILPAMQSFFYCISFGQNPANLKIVMYSEELPLHAGYEYCRQVAQNNASYYNCSLHMPLSCDFIHRLNKSFDVHLEYNLEAAKLRVVHNQAWAYIYLQSNFSSSLIERVHDLLSPKDDIIDSSIAYVTMDMSNYVIANFLQKQLVDLYNEFKIELLKSCNILVRLGEIPLKFEEPVYGNNNPVYAHSGLPGFFCSFCFYFTMIFTSGAIMMEKLVGLLDRSMAAGMTYFEVVGAHLAVQFLLITAQKAVMLLIFYVCFDNPFVGSLSLVIALLFCIEAVGVAYGFLLTEVFSSDRLVTYGGIGATLAVFSLGGIIWPIEGAHIVIRSWVWAFPVAPAVESYKVISSKGYSLIHPQVYSGFLSCIVWVILITSITILIAKSNKLKSI
ncbi:ABC transporter G family member 20-like isoform X1 [Rhodnius prolixus]|uniref:ABC transporter G family member 20-like isoform X1 n=2 Tax=Rhodnius prolixus TaxID=13249 RepID=UPI003D187C46